MCGTPGAGPHMRLIKHTAWAVPPHNFSHPCLPSIRPRLILLGAIAPTRSLNTFKVEPPKSIVAFDRDPQIRIITEVYAVAATSMLGATS